MRMEINAIINETVNGDTVNGDRYQNMTSMKLLF